MQPQWPCRRASAQVLDVMMTACNEASAQPRCAMCNDNCTSFSMSICLTVLRVWLACFRLLLSWHYGTVRFILKVARSSRSTYNHSETTDEESEDEYDEYNGIPVASYVTINKARTFLEKKHGISFRYINEKLIAVDFGGNIHSFGRGEIARPFATEGSLFFDSSQNFELQGDFLVSDHSLGSNRSFNPNMPPTVIVEFASAESLEFIQILTTSFYFIGCEVFTLSFLIY